MDNNIDSLGAARIFSTLHSELRLLTGTNLQTRLAKHRLSSHHGIYKFLQMSIGLKINSATFQRVMDVIFSTVKGQ